MDRQCNIYFFEPWLGVSPTVLALARSLHASGCLVTIYTRKSEMGAAGEIENLVRVRYLTNLALVPVVGAVTRALRSVGLGFLVLPVDILAFFGSILLREIFRWRGDRQHIGVDFIGAPIASFFSRLRGEPLTYLSLELSQPRKFHLAGRLLRFFERRALRASRLLVIQDKDRANALCDYLDYAHPEVFFLPNASGIANAEIERFLHSRDNHFREKFGIGRNTFPYLVLHAGIIHEAACCLELARGFYRQDGPVALVMHSAAQQSVFPEYVERVAAVGHANLFISRDPVPFDQLGKVYAAADIGLCFYRDIDSNYELISRASGKLACFLQFRKPVLMANLPSLVRLNEQYDFGIVIRDASYSNELYTGIERIACDYRRYQDNAERCYREVFDNESRMEELILRLQVPDAPGS